MREKKDRAMTQGKRYVGVRGVCLEECPIVEEANSETMKKECFEFGNTFCYVTKC